MAQDVHGAPFDWAKENPPRIAPGRDRAKRGREGSDHLLDRVAHMRAKVRAIPTVVMALTATDRIETQTVRAPSLMMEMTPIDFAERAFESYIKKSD